MTRRRNSPSQTRLSASTSHGTDFVHSLQAIAPVSFERGFRHRLHRGFVCAMHQHPAIEMVYHPSGRGVTVLHSAADQRIPYKPGTVVIYPRNCPHSQIVDEEGIDCCIHFMCDASLLPFFTKVLVFRNVPENRLGDGLRSLSAPPALLDSGERAVYDLRLLTLLAELWVVQEIKESPRATLESSSPSTRYVQAAKHILSRNLTETISLDDAAGRIGINADYLRHLFVQHEGQTLSHWLRDLRLKRACELLAYSTLPHKAIASECGFSNERYFCTVFRKHLDLTPRQYRIVHHAQQMNKPV
jgi:AraC-like DNA-binding protein